MAEQSKHDSQVDEPDEQRREHARRQIRVVGDPVLRECAPLTTEFGQALRTLADRMIAVMRDAPGVGLAAPQVGVVLRLVVYEVDGRAARALVNPSVVWKSDDTEIVSEGCLSVPGVTVDVERPRQVRVRAQDLDGSRLEFDAADLEARVIQHEIDHLEGTLILERTTREERARALRELRESDTLF